MIEPYCFEYCSPVTNFEIRKCKISNFVSFLACFGCWGQLKFHMNFRMDFFYFKNIIEILIGLVNV